MFDEQRADAGGGRGFGVGDGVADHDRLPKVDAEVVGGL
jgi:hypothetical protein